MKILIIDDEKDQREMLQGFLTKKGYEVSSAANGQEALEIFSKLPFQLILVDHKMPGMTGDEVLAELKKMNPLIRSIMITAYASVDTAVKVMKLGADDFIEKPVDLLKLLEMIQSIDNSLLVEKDASDIFEKIEHSDLPVNIITKCPAMNEVLSLVYKTAPTHWAVLIQGETGTGKELIARLIHLLSNVNQGPFVEVNCGAIPENLFESELFGHEKGAFTGAVSKRRGRFEMADKGTIFLDEIGELPINLQPKLLRALQEKVICRVGSEKDIPVEVRVVAATNRDLKKFIKNGSFREDLYYRINVFEINLPPLRERKEDIPLLIDHFLELYSPNRVKFGQDAMSTLLKYSFPGNVRELEHIIQRTVTLCRGSVITNDDLPAELRDGNYDIKKETLADHLEAMERELLINALEKEAWVQTRAAKSLGISERVLRYKMKKNNIQKRD